MFDPWVREIPWRRKWQLTPVFLPGKSHGLRSLAGNSPWGRKKSDTTEGTRAQKHKEPKYLYARSLKIIFMGYH